jgi:hypothetical protein
MRSLVAKPKTSLEVTPAPPAAARKQFGRNREWDGLPRPEPEGMGCAAGAPGLGCDFGSIAIHAPLRNSVRSFASQSYAGAAAKGESAGKEDPFGKMKGEHDGDNAKAETGTKGEGKKVKKTELGDPVEGQCGAYSWKVRFSVENADNATNGYIVQKIDAKYTRTTCEGADKPVGGIGTFPYWEAWGVRSGKVYIGDTNQEHNADTYSDDSMGDSTKGSIVVTGVPEFFPNAVLPAHMKADNPDTQAHSLRSSTQDPGLANGTGSIAHNLTATWECCGAHDKKTHVTKS